jgi:hypothetical protein
MSSCLSCKFSSRAAALVMVLLASLLPACAEQVRLEDVCRVTKERIASLTSLGDYKRALEAKKSGTATRAQMARLDTVQRWRNMRNYAKCKPSP